MSFLPQRELSHAAAVGAYTALFPDHRSSSSSPCPLAVRRYVMATPTLAQSMQAPLKFSAFCGFFLFSTSSAFPLPLS